MRWLALALGAAPEEVFSVGYAQPPGCVHGCLAWHEVPDSILEPYGYEHSGQLFSDGQAPRAATCALPARLEWEREMPWCYCPGPVEGWAYCDRVPANCSYELEQSFEGKGGAAVQFQAATCMHAALMCGEWVRPCRAAAQGGLLYYQDEEKYNSDGSFERLSYLSPSLDSCERGEYFLKLKSRGSWRHERPSDFKNGTSLMTTEIQEAWLQIRRDVVCEMDDRGDPILCFNTTELLMDFCPCNNWPWRIGDEYIERHIVLFCRPASECQLMHDVVLRRPQYFHYNASKSHICFFSPGTSRQMGWGIGEKKFNPIIEGCIRKKENFDCVKGLHPRPTAFAWLALPAWWLL